ncbi:MAG: OmpA family protein [Nitrospirae bacterium]|nr:OmpA family protein [Nitrospirota bacterium]
MKKLAIIVLLILTLSGCVAKSKYLAQVAETESTKAAFQDEMRKNAALNEQVSRLNSMLAEQKAKIEKLEGEKVEAARRIDELSSIMSGLNADLDKAREAARGDADKFMTEITRLEGERGEAKKKVEGLTSELNRLNSDLTSARNENSNLRAKIDSLSSEVANLNSELEKTKEAVVPVPSPPTTSAEEERLREETARLEKERDELKEKMARLSSEIDRLNSDLTKATTENSGLKGKIDNLSSEVARLTSELAKTKEAALPVPIPLLAPSPEEERLRQETSRLEAEKEELKRKVDQLTSELQKTGEAVVPVPSPPTTSAEEERLRKETARFEKERDELKEKIDKLSSENQKLTLELDHARDSISTLELERAKDAGIIGDLKGKIARLEDEKKVAEKKLNELEEELKKSVSGLETARRESTSKEKEIEEIKRTYESLLDKLKKEVEDGNIKVEMTKEGLSVRIMGKVLFTSGSNKISRSGREVLDRVSGILKEVKDKMIRIEGHTDNKPIGPKIIDKFPTNWELSTSRATQVVKYLAKMGVEPKMMSAAGLSMYNPVATNDTKDGREQNRRIEIILYPKELARIE